MYRLSRSHIPRIPQRQRVAESLLLLTHCPTSLRSYSSDTTQEQHELSKSAKKDALPKHYHLTHPSLSHLDPVLETRLSHVFPPTAKTPFTNEVIIRNVDEDFNSIFDTPEEESSGTRNKEDEQVLEKDSAQVDMKRHLPLQKADWDKLFRFPLISRRVVQQTGKGKIFQLYHLLVVGDGNGLVGYGEGKDLNDNKKALDKAFVQAIRNMDYVERFEKRTIFGEMHTKMGATQLILRPRPVGFGLQCNPWIHQILKAAGIKDISAKVWGSRNPLNVVKALFRVLHSGNAPLYMGDGIGGKGRRMFKGEPIQSREAVERARGRKLFDLRT